MRGRPGCPTGQEKHSVGATGGSPLFLFLQGKVGYRIAPSSAPVCALGHLPPEGKALGVGRTLPVCKTTPPSPPSRWAGRYGRRKMGRRPGRKKRGPPQGPPNQKRWVQGGRTSSALVFFPPAFFQRKPGPRPGPGGQRGAAPRGQLRSHPPEGYAVPPRQARAPTKQGPSFFAQFCATFLPPPCTPACNFGPGSPGGERRFCHAHPP